MGACHSADNRPIKTTIPSTPLDEWTAQEVHEWLSNVYDGQLRRVAKIFLHQEIQGITLDSLNDLHFQAMNLKIGEQLLFVKARQQLMNDNHPPHRHNNSNSTSSYDGTRLHPQIHPQILSNNPHNQALRQQSANNSHTVNTNSHRNMNSNNPNSNNFIFQRPQLPMDCPPSFLHNMPSSNFGESEYATIDPSMISGFESLAKPTTNNALSESRPTLHHPPLSNAKLSNLKSNNSNIPYPFMLSNKSNNMSNHINSTPFKHALQPGACPSNNNDILIKRGLPPISLSNDSFKNSKNSGSRTENTVLDKIKEGSSGSSGSSSSKALALVSLVKHLDLHMKSANVRCLAGNQIVELIKNHTHTDDEVYVLEKCQLMLSEEYLSLSDGPDVPLANIDCRKTFINRSDVSYEINTTIYESELCGTVVEVYSPQTNEWRHGFIIEHHQNSDNIKVCFENMGVAKFQQISLHSSHLRLFPSNALKTGSTSHRIWGNANNVQ